MRRLPFPLLLLTVVSTAADLACGSSSASIPTRRSLIISCCQQAAGCTARGSTSWRKRRAASVGQHPVSADDLLQLNRYLLCRPDGHSPDPRPPKARDSFCARRDAAVRRDATDCHLRKPGLDDCAQDVWRGLIESLRTFRLDCSRGSLSSWPYRVAHGQAVDLKRREARRPPVTLSAGLCETLRDPDPSPLAHQEREQDRAALRLAPFRLQRHAPPESDPVLHLRQMEGWSVLGVTNALALTVEQAWVREHRMKRKLQELLRSHGLMRLPRGNLMGAQVDVA